MQESNIRLTAKLESVEEKLEMLLILVLVRDVIDIQFIICVGYPNSKRVL